MKKNVFIVIFTFILCFNGASSLKAQSALLNEGQQGQEIFSLQTKLNKIGYSYADPTGYFGPITKQAIKNFQYDVGLQVDGVVGPNTRNMMDNINIMAKVVHGEARGESYIGKVGVAAVILNRLDSTDFPHSIHNVVFQTNAFTAVNDGQYYLTPNYDSYRAVIDALKGWDPTYGSVYYYNPYTATDEWIFTRSTITRIGEHVFAK